MSIFENFPIVDAAMRILLSEDAPFQVRLDRAIDEISTLDMSELPADLRDSYDEFIIKVEDYRNNGNTADRGSHEDLATAVLNLYKEYIVWMMVYV